MICGIRYPLTFVDWVYSSTLGREKERMVFLEWSQPTKRLWRRKQNQTGVESTVLFSSPLLHFRFFLFCGSPRLARGQAHWASVYVCVPALIFRLFVSARPSWTHSQRTREPGSQAAGLLGQMEGKPGNLKSFSEHLCVLPQVCWTLLSCSCMVNSAVADRTLCLLCFCKLICIRFMYLQKTSTQVSIWFLVL